MAHPSVATSYLTVVEVADIFRCPPATVRYWQHKGTGPRSVKIGRRRLFREADILAWAEQQAQHEANR